MNPKDLMRHQRIDVPAYLLWVHARPTFKSRGKGKANYMEAVSQAAVQAIPNPILTNDIEIEINYATTRSRGVRADIDNVIKPTLDALTDVAYSDDRQVRSVTATLFDRTQDNLISGRVEHMGRLLYSSDVDVLLIAIYSDTRLGELGGEEARKQYYFDEWERDFNSAIKDHTVLGNDPNRYSPDSD